MAFRSLLGLLLRHNHPCRGYSVVSGADRLKDRFYQGLRLIDLHSENVSINICALHLEKLGPD